MEQYLQHPIVGFVYFQLTKDVAKLPKRLKNGTLSTDKKQKTTHQLVRQTLLNEFGSVANAPDKYIEFLNHVAELEFPEGDRFIRWDLVRRTPAQTIATYNHIMGEVHTMIDPNLYLYPNPTRDCIWDCPVREYCLALDDNRNFDIEMFMKDYKPRPREEDGEQEKWKEHLEYPKEVLPLGDETEFLLSEDDEPLEVVFDDKEDYRD